MAMQSPQRIVRITFLDFRKAFDLINHNVLLENFMQIGVRPAVVGWFASYLYNRSQVTSFHGEQSIVNESREAFHKGLSWVLLRL